MSNDKPKQQKNKTQSNQEQPVQVGTLGDLVRPKEPPKPHPQWAAARFFLDLNKDEYLYRVSDDGDGWLRFNGCIYETDKSVSNDLYHELETITDESKRSYHFVNSVRNMVREHLTEPDENFNQAANILGANYYDRETDCRFNLDLCDWRLFYANNPPIFTKTESHIERIREQTAAYRITKRINPNIDRLLLPGSDEYESQIEDSTWISCITEWTNGNFELQKFLQVWAGLCLTTITSDHLALFLHGRGGSGKSTFLNTIVDILGDYADVTNIKLFSSDRSKHDTSVRQIKDKRLIVAPELSEIIQSELFKQITGADPVNAREIYKSATDATFIPVCKLAMTCNELPTLTDADSGIKRRILVIPFNFKPTQPDGQLQEKLRSEYPLILGWILEGHHDYMSSIQVEGNGHKTGLRSFVPEIVQVATNDYFRDMDTVGAWISERCDLDDHANSKGNQLYKDYCDHFKRSRLNRNKFYDKLENKEFVKYRPGGVIHFKGIRIKPDDYSMEFVNELDTDSSADYDKNLPGF